MATQSKANGEQDYHPDDLKGKGEPSFSVERALKGHESNSHRRQASDGGVELTYRTAHRRAGSNGTAATSSVSHKARGSNGHAAVGRERSDSGREENDISRKLGSLGLRNGRVHQVEQA